MKLTIESIEVQQVGVVVSLIEHLELAQAGTQTAYRDGQTCSKMGHEQMDRLTYLLTPFSHRNSIQTVGSGKPERQSHMLANVLDNNRVVCIAVDDLWHALKYLLCVYLISDFNWMQQVANGRMYSMTRTGRSHTGTWKNEEKLMDCHCIGRPAPRTTKQLVGLASSVAKPGD